jgi:uncharacterized Fe-S cluster-containing radical SAM superfamily protein
MTNNPLTVIDTEKFSASLRSRGIRIEEKQILFTQFSGSQQARDLAVPPNCGGFGRIHHFGRHQGAGWPENPLPIDPACHALGLPRTDSMDAQVFQNAICSWRCWYCFVDFDLLSANPDHSTFKTVAELVDLYLAEIHRPVLVDLSGGQPDLVPEWLLWFTDEFRNRGLELETYLWSDDNLSNDYLWRYLKPVEIQRIVSYRNYGRVGCFKGFDPHSFSFNTRAQPDLFAQQFKLMSRLVEAGFDVYGYATFTSDMENDLPQFMADFVDRLQSNIHPLFPLKLIPLRIHAFTPTRSRMGDPQNRSLQIQDEAIAIWSEELTKRFPEETRSKAIYEHRLNSATHV